MTALTFEEFLNTVNADVEEHRAAFEQALAARPVDFLAPVRTTPSPTYRDYDLRAWWDQRCQQHLADVLDTWMHTRDHLGDPLAKWSILRRRLSGTYPLVQFLESKILPRGRASLPADSRLLYALQQLRCGGALRAEKFLGGVSRRLYATERVRQVATQCARADFS